MIPSNDISKAMTMAQKLSDQMAAFDKINSALSKFDSLKVITAKNFEEFIDASKFGEVICQSYQKTAIDAKFYDEVCSNTFFKYQNLIPDISKGVKFYGGGSLEPISSTAFLSLSINKYKEVDIDVLLPTVKVKYLDNWFKSLELNKAGNIISKLYTLDTIRSIAEQKVIEKLNSRNEALHRISNIVYSIEGSYQTTTKLDYEKDRFCCREYHRLYDSLYYSISELISEDAIINSELAKIELLNRVYIAIKVCLKKTTLNKREIFRKINSFHFKNLDDYHSISFAA